MMVDNNLDYLEVSPTDKWNWLHQLLMGFSEKSSLESIKLLIDKGFPLMLKIVMVKHHCYMQWEVKIQMLPFYCWKTEQTQTFMIKK